MGKIGSWGRTITFEVSSNKTLTFNNFKRTVSARWHTHNIVNGKPKSEFAGPDSSSVTLKQCSQQKEVCGREPHWKNWKKPARAEQWTICTSAERRSEPGR